MDNIVCLNAKHNDKLARKLITWVRERTCGLVYGTKDEANVKPSILLDDLRFRLNHTPVLPRLSNAGYDAHFTGDATHYFYGGHRLTQSEILAKIDIDVMKSKGLGSTAGAWAFAEHLKTKWPSLYLEPSTGGKGVHCFFVLRKGDLGSRLVRTALRRLEQWLREEAARLGADIELVEVKGLPPEIGRDRAGLVSYIRAGEWAKIPRQVRRAEEIMNTTRLTIRDIQALPLDAEPESDDVPLPIAEMRTHAGKTYIVERDQFGIPVLVDPPPAKPAPVISIPSLVIPTTADPERPPTPSTPLRPAPAMKVRRAVVKCMVESKTSTYGQGRRIDAAHVQIIADAIKKTGYCDGFKVKNRKVTPEDVAIVLAILRHCTKRMNADGSLPAARVLSMWRAVYQCGDVSRAPNAEIYIAVQRRLLATGAIDIEDMTYLPPMYTDDGTRIPGQACKWRLSQALMNDLDKLIAQKSTEPVESPALLTGKGGALIHSIFRPRPLPTDYPVPTLRFKVWNAVIDRGRDAEDQFYAWAA